MAEESGSRKVKDARESSLLLLGGLALCAWLKADVQLYFAFVAGVVGKTGVFNWGNAKEHESNAVVQVAQVKAGAPPTGPEVAKAV